MKQNNRVVWAEGMFLRVQQFQQSDRWVERLNAASNTTLQAFPWGVSQLSINNDVLGQGQFALKTLTGFMPDGTYFSAPDYCDLPNAVTLSPDIKDTVVYLCLPLQQDGRDDVRAVDQKAITRHIAYDYDTLDTNTGSDITAQIKVARLELVLRLDGEDMSGYSRIPIAKISEVRKDQSIVLDEDYIPTTLNCLASSRLDAMMNTLLGIMIHRADVMANRIGNPTVRENIHDYLQLQLLNRYAALFQHHKDNAGSLHPVDFYTVCLELASELATFTSPGKRPPAFSGYTHGDLTTCFPPVWQEIRRSLEAIVDVSAFRIDLKTTEANIDTGSLPDTVVARPVILILAVRAQINMEDLRQKFPRNLTIGDATNINNLISTQMRGIAVTPEAVAPYELPTTADTVYFRLDQTSPYWKGVQEARSIALHLAGTFPSVEYELWAIKVKTQHDT